MIESVRRIDGLIDLPGGGSLPPKKTESGASFKQKLAAKSKPPSSKPSSKPSGTAGQTPPPSSTTRPPAASKPKINLKIPFPASKALAKSKPSLRRDREASRNLTSQQAETASKLTGERPEPSGQPIDARAFWQGTELPDEVNREPALERTEQERETFASESADGPQSELELLSFDSLSEETERGEGGSGGAESDDQSPEEQAEPIPYSESAERIEAAPEGEERTQAIIDELAQPGADTQAIVAAHSSSVVEEFDTLPPETVTETVEIFVSAVEDDPEAAEVLAGEIIEHLPDDPTPVLAGIATASIEGHTTVGETIVEIYEKLPPNHLSGIVNRGSQFERVTQVGEEFRQAETAAERAEIIAQGPPSSPATQAILQVATPGIVQELRAQPSEARAQTVADLARAAGDNEESIDIVASELASLFPPNGAPGAPGSGDPLGPLKDSLDGGLVTAAIEGQNGVAQALADKLGEPYELYSERLESFEELGADIREAESPAVLVQILKGQDLAFTDRQFEASLLQAASPHLLESFEDASPEEITQALADFSVLVGDRPELAETLAQQFREDLPATTNLIEGLAEGSALGGSVFTQALAGELESSRPSLAEDLETSARLGLEISEAETLEDKAAVLEEFVSGSDSLDPRVIAGSAAGIFSEFDSAEGEEVTRALTLVSQIAEGDEQVATLLARELAQNPPRDLDEALLGLATASAQGNNALTLAFANELDELENPAAEQVRQAADLAQVSTELTELIDVYNNPPDPGPEHSLNSALAAVELITASTEGAPPEVVQALLTEFEANGNLETLAPILGDLANGHVSRFDDESFLTPTNGILTDNPHNNGEKFTRIIVGFSNAIATVDDPELTNLYGGHIADAVTKWGGNEHHFGPAFEMAIGEGAGAALATSVATHLHQRGEVGVSARIVESIELGANQFVHRFDDVADRVDTANADVAYFVANWGYLYEPLDDPENSAAFNEDLAEVRARHPEYAELDHLSRNIGDDLNNLRELQGLFPEKQHLKDREEDLLKEFPRFSQTENGKRAIADAVMESGMGQESFLDRYMDEDFRAGLDSSFWTDNGFETWDDFQDAVGGQVLNSTLAAYTEASLHSNQHEIEMLEEGLVAQSALLGADPNQVRSITNEFSNITDAANNITNLTADTIGHFSEELEEITSRIATKAAGMSPALAGQLRGFGATLGTVSIALNVSQAFQGDLSLLEGVTLTSETLKMGLEVLGPDGFNTFNGRGAAYFRGGAKVFGAVGVGLSAYGVVQALQAEDYSQAAIGSLGVIGGIATVAGSTGVGLAFSGVALAAGVALGHYRKVQASNRFESDDARLFISNALEHAGFEGDIDGVTNELINADSEGRQTGILIQQAAERGGADPTEFLLELISRSPSDVKKIIEAGHGVDPVGDRLDDLPQSNEEADALVGTKLGGVGDRIGPMTVEGFLIWLEQQGIIDRFDSGAVVL